MACQYVIAILTVRLQSLKNTLDGEWVSVFHLIRVTMVSLYEQRTHKNSGKTKFQLSCASRGFHKYREIWNPILGQNLSVQQELGNVHGPFALSLSVKIPGELTKRDIIGHIPREISRFCHYK